MMGNLPENEPCYRCSGTMRRTTKKENIEFRGFTSPDFAMPVYRCAECAEEYVKGRDMRISDTVLYELKRRAQAAELEEAS